MNWATVLSVYLNTSLKVTIKCIQLDFLMTLWVEGEHALGE